MYFYHFDVRTVSANIASNLTSCQNRLYGQNPFKILSYIPPPGASHWQMHESEFLLLFNVIPRTIWAQATILIFLSYSGEMWNLKLGSNLYLDAKSQPIFEISPWIHDHVYTDLKQSPLFVLQQYIPWSL